MTSVPVTADVSVESLMAEAADEFIERLNRGEQPDIEDYARRYPAVAQFIRQMFPALQLLRQPGSVSSPAEVLPPADDGQAPGCLGDYRILREVGRGGMGVVYEAEQISLNRRVALKVLPFAATLDPRRLQRFKNEAQAAAQLHHTNIVPVHGVGCERGVHYYAMQFIDGQTLAGLIAQLRCLSHRDGPAAAADPDPTGPYPTGDTSNVAAGRLTERSWATPAYFRRAAGLGAQAAEALEHAHQMGVVHRDIKPANLLVDAHGKLWITDFGLAQVQSDTRLTLSGDLVGTLRYMSPEQALGGRTAVDHRTDVYSLGAALYELLTLEPAFDGADRQELLHKIAVEEPRPPRRLSRELPAELETIVLKALARNPAERYATAQELADDLGRFLRDEPIRARRPTPWQRVKKWGKRHRRLVLTAAMSAVLALAASVIVLADSNRRISAEQEQTRIEQEQTRKAQHETEIALQRERQANVDLRRTLYSHNVEMADRYWWAGHVDRAEHLLDECPPELRRWEWHYLKRICHSEELVLDGHRAPVLRVAFNPDGTRLASADETGRVMIWDVTGGRRSEPPAPLLTFAGHARHVFALAFSPDGRLLASGGTDKVVKVWDATTGKEVLRLEGHALAVRALCFSPDGRLLASGGADGKLVVWDVPAGSLAHTLLGHRSMALAVSFVFNNATLVSAGSDQTVRYWDLTTSKESRTLTFSHPSAFALAFNLRPTLRLLSAGQDQTVKIWDMAAGKLLLNMPGHTETVNHVLFSPDGGLVASTSKDRTVRVWNTASGREMRALRGHRGEVFGLAFRPDGRLLASGGRDGVIRLWNPVADQNSTPLVLAAQPGPVLRLVTPSALGFAEGSERVVFRVQAVALKNGVRPSEFRVADVGTGRETGTLPFTSPHHLVVSVGPDGLVDRAAVFGDGTTTIVDVMNNREVATLPLALGQSAVAALGPAGRLLAVREGTGPVRLWDVPAARELPPLEAPDGPFLSFGFSPDGRLLAGAVQDGLVKVWDVATGGLRLALRGHTGRVHRVTFNQDSTLVASAGEDKTVRLWDVTTGHMVHVLRGHTDLVHSLAFHPDRRLASGGADAVIKLWDTDSGHELLTLRGHDEPVMGVTFSPDGRRLLSQGLRRGARLWDAAAWQGPLAPPATEDQAPSPGP